MSSRSDDGPALSFLAAWWGSNHLGVEAMVRRVADAGYDGIETFVPADAGERTRLADAIGAAGLSCVAHIYESAATPRECADLAVQRFHQAADLAPLFVNSHTGKDFWTPDQNDVVIDALRRASAATGMAVCHETHRTRFPYAAAVARTYVDRHPDLRLTADLSHWACVSETLLEDQADNLAVAVERVDHLHARIGHAQGGQVTDPRLDRWDRERAAHLAWWTAIRDSFARRGRGTLTITMEIGPPPYMAVDDVTGEPLYDFFEQNLWLREYLRGELSMPSTSAD